jgi:hypothetical protein
VSRALAILSLAYPVLAFQGWAFMAVWSQRALFAGKVAALFEKWFDRKLYGELRQFLVAAIGAAIIETLLKILIISLAIFQARNL